MTDAHTPGTRETTKPGAFNRESVDKLLADLPDTQESRPAIQKLSSDQRELVASFVDGFVSRREFLLWCQNAAVLTLGELSGEWFRERAFSRVDMSVLVTSAKRARWVPDGEEPTGPETSHRVRRGVVALDVLPACVDAHRRLRWSATEYVNDADDTLQPDPDAQKHPAMRPALTEVGERQEWALKRLLSGFDSHDAVLTWFQILTEAAYAELDGTLAKRVLVEDTRTIEMLVSSPEDRPEAPAFRESFAAFYLLPAFATAAHEVADRAGELAEKETAEITETLI